MEKTKNETRNGAPLIYKSLAAINRGVGHIAKTEKNAQQGFRFRGIDNVMNELHALFALHGVIVRQEVVSYATENRPTKSGGMNTYTRATVRFSYTAEDGSCLDTVNVGEAMDAGDKGMSKAMSIALKYSLLQMFLIPTDEKKDTDADTPEETDYAALAMQEIKGARSVRTLADIYESYPGLRGDKDFMDALSARKKELRDEAESF